MASARALALGLAVISSTAGAQSDGEELPPGWTTAGRSPRQLPPDEGLSRWYPMGIAGGACLGASFGALPYYLVGTLNGTGDSRCGGSICALAALGGTGLGIVVGGLLGWRLCLLSTEGATWAKVLIVVFDALGLPTTVGSYLAAAYGTGDLPTSAGPP